MADEQKRGLSDNATKVLLTLLGLVGVALGIIGNVVAARNGEKLAVQTKVIEVQREEIGMQRMKLADQEVKSAVLESKVEENHQMIIRNGVFKPKELIPRSEK